MSRRAAMTVILGLVTGAFVQAAAPVWVIDLDDVIGASSARYLSDSLEDARALDVPLVVLRIDTPGGWMDSTRDIVKDILASPVPVAAYVSPEGASATSAGTYIVYASHVAAMAPATNIGSATPVRRRQSMRSVLRGYIAGNPRWPNSKADTTAATTAWRSAGSRCPENRARWRRRSLWLRPAVWHPVPWTM